MDQQPARSHHSVQRIILPSGRTIEVVRFEDCQGLRDLRFCPECDCDLVQPTEWCEGADGRWQLALECPNCGWCEAGVYDREQVERLEQSLDQGLAEMITDLQRLSQANMAADVERFVHALTADLVLPEDF
jgi:hypothetical protein